MNTKRTAAKEFAKYLTLSFLLTGLFVMCTHQTDDINPEPPENGNSQALTESDFTHSVTIAHYYFNQFLYGSTARLSVEVNKSELAHAVNGIRVENAKLVRNSVTYCTLSSSSFGGHKLSANLSNTSSTPYIPKGEYTYSADVYYTVTSSAGMTTEFKVSISGKATSVSPDATKFTMDANITGYTSYSCYKGTDGQSASVTNANNCDDATIYNVGATYKSGMYSKIYEQCKDLLNIKTYIDSVEHSGDVGGQSLGPHTISASLSFDGSNPTTVQTTSTVHISGLPFTESFDNADIWDRTDNTTKDGVVGLKLGGGKGDASATLKNHFSVPASTNVKVLSDVYLCSNKIIIKYDLTTYSVRIGESTLISQESNKTMGEVYFPSLHGETSITGQNSLVINSSNTNNGAYSRVTYLRVEYR